MDEHKAARPIDKFRHVRHWFLFFIALSISLFIEAFDSFRQASGHGELSANIARIAIEPVLDLITRQRTYDEAARQAITVFVIDRTTQADTKDAGAYAYDTPFMPYAYQAAYVRQIAAFKPRIIFLDFVFRREGDKAGYDALVDAIAAARQAGIKVYVGLDSDHAYFAGLGSGTDRVATEWPKGKHALDYPFYGDDALGNPDKRTTPMAASAIYQAVCADPTHGPSFRCDLSVLPPATREEDKAMAPIMVHMPQYQAHPGELYSQEPVCRQAPQNAVDGYMRDLARNLLYNLTDPEHRGADKCLYISSFSLSRVFAFARLNKPDAPLLQNYVTGKVVMIGDGMEDVIDVPAHGLIPGVFHHAFALQNLLAHDKGYIHWPAEWKAIHLTLPVNFIIEWLLTALEVLIITEIHAISGWSAAVFDRFSAITDRIAWLLKIKRPRLRGNTLATVLTVVAIVFALAYVIDLGMYLGLHWVPVNPVYIVTLIAIFHVLADQDRIFVYWLRLKTWQRASAIVVPPALVMAAVAILWCRYLA